MGKTIAWMGLLLSILNALSAQDWLVTKEEFAKRGINYNALQLVNLSPQGDYLTATELVNDVKIKAKGVTQILHVFRCKDKKLDKVDSVQIPITQMVNSALSDTRNEVWITGDYGNRYVRVNLGDMKPEIVFDYHKGISGFKAQAFLFAYKGEFFSTGWFYDKDQYTLGDALAKLELSKGDKLKFVKKIDLDKLYNADASANVTTFYYVSGDLVYFNMIKPREKTTYLMAYKNQERIVVDQAYSLGAFIGTESRVFYTAKKEEKGPLQHFIKDLQTKKTWKIGEDNIPYTYPFMSVKGDVLVVVAISRNLNAIDAFFGDEKDNYRLKRFLKKEQAGPMKLSGNGKVYVLMRQDGLKYGEIK
jgi:hypothetical protein